MNVEIQKRLERRIEETKEFLVQSDPFCFTEQKHTDEGTPERVYWHYGYMVALMDVLRKSREGVPEKMPETEHTKSVLRSPLGLPDGIS